MVILIPYNPGVRERLEEARQGDLRTAIVTRNREARVRATCSAAGLEHHWDALLCANDEPTRDKAELCRDALDALAVPVNDALAFEDSPAGVRAARDAGVRCVAIPNETTRSATFDDASLVLASLAGCPRSSRCRTLRAKPSQVRQFLRLVERYAPTLEDER